jgi:hypothetical protein
MRPSTSRNQSTGSILASSHKHKCAAGDPLPRTIVELHVLVVRITGELGNGTSSLHGRPRKRESNWRLRCRCTTALEIHADVTKLRSTAAVFPPLSLPKKVQLLRLCARLHKRNFAQSLVMCSPPSLKAAHIGGT